MAVDNWFQNWNPPASLITEHGFLRGSMTRNETDDDQERSRKKGSPHSPANFLPYLVSLGFMQVPPKLFDDDPDHHDLYPEKTGPFVTKYFWKQLDYKFPSKEERASAIYNGDFIPENNLPLGLEVYKDRLFVTMPKWKSGIPVTLAVLPRVPKEKSPLLVPYPSWSWHRTDSCYSLTSVFRVQADSCGRLWVLDSGQVEITTKPQQICPPAIYIFNLKNDKLVYKYNLPDEFVKEDSLYSNIIVDFRENDCKNVHAYLTDVWRFGLVVFSLRRKKSWRITDHLFYPDPLAAAYKLHDLEFEWTDGLFGLTLGPYNKKLDDRLLYFNPMSSFRQFYVKTSVICNETGWSEVKDAFKVIGQSRGKSGHVSASVMDKNGIMLFNLVTKDAIGCWDFRKPYKRSNLAIVAQNRETLVFPNDLKIDNEKKASAWIITNKLPFYLYRGLNKNAVNFRVMSTYIDEAIKGTICDPRVAYSDTFLPYEDDQDCF